MKNFPFLCGLFNFILLFVLCFIAVFGLKSLLMFLGILPPTVAKSSPPPAKPKKRPPLKTLTINPDDYDRIYVKRKNQNS
jgi:hypothetical protein